MSRGHNPRTPLFWNVWIGDEDRQIDWGKIGRIWQRRD
jgi:hypothetical protein